MAGYFRIPFNAHEVAQGIAVGQARVIHAQATGAKPRWEYDGDGWLEHITGALGELGFAKSMGAYWSPVPGSDRERGDVVGIDVKASMEPKALWVKSYIPGHRVLVRAVVHRLSACHLYGWVTADVARTVGEFRDDWDAWGVELDQLWGMDTLAGWPFERWERVAA